MIKIKYLSSYPHKLAPAKVGDAGIDIVASESVNIQANDTELVHTGLYVEIPEGYYIEVVGRSSLHKRGIHVNKGIIDTGYRGEILVSMSNRNFWDIDESDYLSVIKGDRIAQLIVKKKVEVKFEPVDKLEDSERGEDGFGSTDR